MLKQILSKLITRYLAWNARGVAAGFGSKRAEEYIAQSHWFISYWFGIPLHPDEIASLAHLKESQHD